MRPSATLVRFADSFRAARSESRRPGFSGGVLITVATAITAGCDRPASEPGTTSTPAADATPASTDGGSTTATVSTDRRGYEIPIPQLEYWDGTKVLKYSYEMRFDPPDQPDGRPGLHRNGWARAYYLSGQLEREGAYRYVANAGRSERVGRWTYYTPEGTVDRTEDRGGEIVWTGPDQLIAPPGTEPATP